MTKEDIQRLREEALKAQEHHLANANQAAGAVKMCDMILQQWNRPESPPAAN
jgi:hypothetical protein